ncbi:MAG TPA: peptidoglycan DD-metalloendopeptidase family protein [Vitreimonas sp.]|nr:peptidoglycan DD-metalloendopeptidase family protein [Vitreimonas sp.]
MAGAKRARALAACVAGALAVFLGSADAQTTRTAAQADRERRTESARAERLRTQASAARREVQALDARLVASGQRRAEAEAAATAAEERLNALHQQLQVLTAERAHARDSLESALIAAAFAQRRVDRRAVRAGIFARAASAEFSAAHRSTSVALQDTQRLEAAVTEERQVLADAQAAIDAERAELVTLAARRRTAQAQLARDATAAERRVRTLAAEARNLRELAQRAAATPRRPSTGSGVVPTAWLAPAQGSIVRNYGAREGQGPAAQGATLHTRSSAQIVSPAAGEVAYAGLFRSYGNVLILNVDGGYVLVLTGLETITVQAGETVRAGQPIGEMPSSDTAAPELYVEVRREGRTIDPGRWLAARGLAADRGVRAG